ncbi:MAG: cupredoxin domain-containing protein [Actinomycetota bacterium]|nr:cupredoxin domain-containing protein [Actinomycetota bacterium]
MRHTRAVVAVVIAVVAVALLVVLWPRSSDRDGRSRGSREPAAVAASGLSYAPAELRVPAGSVVTFTNRDDVVHTFTADGGLFDSGPKQPGESFTYSFAGPRTVSFHCEVHPAMRGTVTVDGR